MVPPPRPRPGGKDHSRGRVHRSRRRGQTVSPPRRRMEARVPGPFEDGPSRSPPLAKATLERAGEARPPGWSG